MRTLIWGLALVLAACGGSPPDLGTIRPRDPPPDMAHDWIVVTVEGFVPAPGTALVDFIEVDPDGRAMTVFFRGGATECYGVAGVDFERRDPEPPVATVRYGLRFGVMGCNAAGTFLAIRQPLVPTFVP
jgi:hypothetical protein